MEFVSVREVLDSIADQFPVPQGCIDSLPNSDTPDSDPSVVWHNTGQNQAPSITRVYHDFRLRMLNDLFRSAFQRSNAAAVLDQYLHNSAQRPKWYDRAETGRPKVSETAHAEVQPMLVHMAHYFDRCMTAFRARRFENWPRGSNLLSSEGKFRKPADDKRMELVGFDRSELVEFLNCHAISHSFGVTAATCASQAPENSTIEKPVLSRTEPELFVEATNSERALEFSRASTSPGTGNVVHRMRKPGDHKLRKLIDQAREHANDREDAEEVWGILRAMAERERAERPPEMKKYVEGKGIEFDRGVSTRYFTLSHLRKQFSYERNKRPQMLANSAEFDQAATS